MNYQLHPLCTLFPRLADAEFSTLVADIKANGLRQPIILHEGMILDGGNRYRACVAAGVAPRFEQFTGGNIVSFVLSANLHRRHLSAGQQAAIVASAQDWAKAQTIGRPEKVAETTFSTVEQRAAASGASRDTQLRADKVAKASPELARKVAHGEISLPKAVEQVTGKRPGIKSKPVAAPEPMSEPDGFGPSDEEIAAFQAQEAADKAMLEKVLSSDEPMAAAHAEIKRLNAENAVLRGQRDQYMNKCNELIRQVKALKREANRAA